MQCRATASRSPVGPALRDVSLHRRGRRLPLTSTAREESRIRPSGGRHPRPARHGPPGRSCRSRSRPSSVFVSMNDICSPAMSATPSEPSVLYHYTDAFGLVGIVSPSPSSWPVPGDNPEKHYKRAVKLLASDVRFMNDTQELKFGARLLRARLLASAVNPATPPEFQVAFGEDPADLQRAGPCVGAEVLCKLLLRRR